MYSLIECFIENNAPCCLFPCERGRATRRDPPPAPRSAVLPPIGRRTCQSTRAAMVTDSPAAAGLWQRRRGGGEVEKKKRREAEVHPPWAGLSRHLSQPSTMTWLPGRGALILSPRAAVPLVSKLVVECQFANVSPLAHVFTRTEPNEPSAMIPECPRAGDSRSRGRFVYSPAAEPSRGASGLLTEIRTSINNQPFTDHYTIIPGKELGRYHQLTHSLTYRTSSCPVVDQRNLWLLVVNVEVLC